MPLPQKPRNKNLFKTMAPARAGMIIRNLKRENAILMKSLNELIRHHNNHNRIIENLIPFRPLSEEYEAHEGANCMLSQMPEEQRSHEENQSDGVNTRRLSYFAKEVKDVKNELVRVSVKCQDLECTATKKQERAVEDNSAIITELQMNLNDALEKNKQWMDYDQQRETYVKSIVTRMSWLERHLGEERAVEDNSAIITELQMNLNDALEKNKQWMDYDQQRETYVKSIVTRMSWLERHLGEERAVEDNSAIITELQMNLNDALEKNKQWMDYDQQRETYVKSIVTRMSWLERHLGEVSEAREARVAERNEFKLNERKKIKQVELYYEGLIQKTHEELAIIREQVCLTQQALTQAQSECREKQFDMDQVQLQLQCESEAQRAPHTTEDEEESLTIEPGELLEKLNKERRKSATLELQTGHLQKYFINHYHEAQGQIAKFERVIEVLVQDLHDEKENCSYLKQQLELAQMQTVEKEDTEKADHLDQHSAHPSDLPPLPPKPCHPLSQQVNTTSSSNTWTNAKTKTYNIPQMNFITKYLNFRK